MLESLLPTQEIQIEPLAPGVRLAPPWLMWVLREGINGSYICLSNTIQERTVIPKQPDIHVGTEKP